ncbi:MAG: hypothetical protein COX44_00560 [Candidatus Portnoybacteria bacterium CG23_combo_of_CG06-09_8_20_14_all_37_13]|uniref:HEPN domain-containing protein n=1 Tax=Candidatus Portnoybacteria bacterium CG23_combo_of_CG06-09_8_20_14_all_37_13 TaxID=1974819 RepID=A0A2G9YDK4_9BACT|nr:MAG: hypothetical protein COX44_00560 [Candidatus Portnoybacteria bacterium CG23_combo_of_CG06-09_8_20_14_all_37_13]
MNSLEFQKCLENKKIKPFPKGKTLVSKELEIAGDDWKIAKESLNKKNYKWSIIQSYYSMFHAARALLYNQGYREKSHYCLVVGIRKLYVNKNLLGHTLIEALQLGKTLRENADYYADFSQTGAKNMLDKAKEFLEKTKEILRKPCRY